MTLFFLRVALLSCLFSTPWAMAQSTKLVKTKINDYLTLSIPEEFITMPENVYRKKYGAYRAPLGIYTSPDGKADLGINQMTNQLVTAVVKADWKEEDLKVLQGMYKASIGAMHEKVEFIQETIEEINKKTFIVFEFIGTVRDVDTNGKASGKELKQYSYIQYTVRDRQVILFNFTCPASQRSYHQATAKSVMHSIKLK